MWWQGPLPRGLPGAMWLPHNWFQGTGSGRPETGQCHFADFFWSAVMKPRCSGRSGRESQDHVLEPALSLWILMTEAFSVLMPAEHLQNQLFCVAMKNNTLEN